MAETEHLQEAANYVKSKFENADKVFENCVGVVLGSGLGDFHKILSDTIVIEYEHIPHMPRVTVQSHHGQLICGRIRENDQHSPLILCFSGRVHSYEGIPWQHVCFQVRLLSTLGAKLYVVTNATGGMLDGMVPGCLCLLNDHFRFMARKDPLSDFEIPQELVTRSKSNSHYWDESINSITRQAAKDLNITLFEGSYVWTSGPSFETPLEVHVAKELGGAVVGMSTVPEVVTAHAYGLSVLGISMVTNLAAGLSTSELNHEEVFTNANNSILYLKSLLKKVLLSLDEYMANHDEVKITDKSIKKIIKRPFPSSATALKEAVEDSCKRISELSSSIGSRAYIVNSRNVTKSQETTIALSDLPQFPLQSSGSNFGSISIVNGNELCIVSGDEEGFTIEESAFIALVLYTLNVQTVSIAVSGSATNRSAATSDKLVQLDDLYHFHDSDAPIHPYLTYLNEGSFSNQFLFPYKHSSGANSYMSFCGPSTPSDGEFKVAAKLNQKYIGTTSVSPIYSLRYLGIDVVAFVSEQNDAKLADVISQISVGNSTTESKHKALNYEQLGNMIKKIESLHVQYHDNISFEKLSDLANKIRAQVQNVPSVAILDYDLSLEKALNAGNQVKTIATIDVATKVVGQDAILKVLDYNGVPFFLLSSELAVDHSKQEEMKLDWSNYVRLFQHLLVKHVVFTQCFVGIADNKIQLGDVIQLSDHANFTGNNPMIGPNNDLYGPRFFDMSHVYTDIQSTDLHNVKCLQLPMVHTCRSLSEFRVARDVFGANVVTSQGGKEAIISQHCALVNNFKCSMLGVVDELINLETVEFKQQKVTDESKSKVATILLSKVVLNRD